uniref:Protein ECT2-like n=3 Tax=Hirondellea gigas TaxID=1518452 RepID=A0A6A7G201_9CRUS
MDRTCQASFECSVTSEHHPDETTSSTVSHATTTVGQSTCQGELRLCLVGALATDDEALGAAQKFKLSVVTSVDGLDYVYDATYWTYFVLADFDSAEYEELHKHTSRLIGKPALLDMAVGGESNKGTAVVGVAAVVAQPQLVLHTRAVYCHVMKSCVMVFTGFRKRNEVARLLKQIHFMGGSVKNEMSEKVTHLIAVTATGEKYQYAVTFGVPVMTHHWVNTAWAHRDDQGASAKKPEIMEQYKLGLFHNLRVVPVGFNADDTEVMKRLLGDSRGTCTTLSDPAVTHVVLDDGNVKEKPPDYPSKAYVVKGEWFWASIQMNACANESMYMFEDTNEKPAASGVVSPRGGSTTGSIGGVGGSIASSGGERGGGGLFSPATPRSRSRRRKRLRETMQQLASDDSPCTPGSQLTLPASKRRSSVADLISYMSGDGSFLEDSQHTPVCPLPSIKKTPLSPPNIDLRLLTYRQRVFHELVKTECNYVSILDTINKVIKEPLEDDSQPGGPMLDSQELRYIFGNLPPIHDVHTKMRNDFLYLSHNWKPDASIGQIVLNYSDDLEKAYPPFVNYFENVKEMLAKICHERPRFHAFLKIAQSKPECGRQSFQELLIRPVQRLPSMSLLLCDILKHTDKSHSDHSALSKALDKIKSVTMFINDNKRKTEAKLKLFEIHNDIENCPPNLVASHRTYVSRADVTELSDTCSSRGDLLTLFVFNDVLEICKRKSKYNSIKSPSRANLHAIRTIKTYKHLEMMSLGHIKRIVDIRETDECQQVFALIVRTNQELKERLLTFTFTSPTDDPSLKATFLNTLTRTVANVICRSDVENFLVVMDPHHLDIETSDVGLATALSKAVRFAARTGRKVSRAFSFNKSPGGKLKRAVSTVMSPFATPPNNSMRGASSVASLADLSMTGTVPTVTSASMVGVGTTGNVSVMVTPTSRRRLPLKNL